MNSIRVKKYAKIVAPIAGLLFLLWFLANLGVFNNTTSADIKELKRDWEVQKLQYNIEILNLNHELDSVKISTARLEKETASLKQKQKEIDRKYESLEKERTDIDAVLPQRPKL